MAKTIFIAYLDNGMGLARLRWARSLVGAVLDGALNGWQVTDNHFSSPYPSAGANIAAHYFLKSGCEWLWLQDVDIVYTPQHLRWLLSHNVPWVGGIVPKRVLGLELAIFPYEPLAEDPHAEGINPLVDAACGRGFVLIHRNVFETCKSHVPVYMDDQEAGEDAGTMRYEFFRSKPGGHSEDFALCELYRKLGGKTYIDQRITLQHEGSAVYPIPGTY